MELSTEMAFSWSLIVGLEKKCQSFFFPLLNKQQQAQPNLEGARKVLKALPRGILRKVYVVHISYPQV